MVKVEIMTVCAYCHKPVQNGIMLSETEFQGVGDPGRILQWHKECCPKHVKERYDEITSVEDNEPPREQDY